MRHLWYLSNRITEGGSVHIMISNLIRYDDIAYMQSCVQPTGGTGIDDEVGTVAIDDKSGSYSRIDFTDTGLHQHHFLVFDFPSCKNKVEMRFLCFFCHIFQQNTVFFFHCSNNSDHECFLPCICIVML
ncbi:hypothetical protein SDC9_161841 [bioreactor metagenome]|uniref:Uncharacterized protein n=1 Tax=bioreactor metagenome TaxID=1076179 RepID=A0A645FQK6_9ZZZZ